MSVLSSFYDRYHQKNDYFAKIIGDNNFTYFYSLQFLRKIFARQFLGKKVLDVGCGVGTLSLYLADKGAKVKGIDISPRAIRIAQRAQQHLGLKNLQFAVTEIDQGKDQYDVVICSEIIEHVKDDGHFLDLIYSQLNVSGELFLSTPSSQNLLYRVGFYQRFDQEVGHLRRYTGESVKQLLAKHHFQVTAMRSVEGPLRNILFTTPLGFLIRIIKGPLIPFFHYIDGITAWLFGASDIQVIAKKR